MPRERVAIAFFRSAVGAKAPWPTAQAVGQQAEIDRSPARGERGPRPSHIRVLLSPLRGSTELSHNSHGLRRGLWLFRAYGASEWPADPKRCWLHPRRRAAGAWRTALHLRIFGRVRLQRPRAGGRHCSRVSTGFEIRGEPPALHYGRYPAIQTSGTPEVQTSGICRWRPVHESYSRDVRPSLARTMRQSRRPGLR